VTRRVLLFGTFDLEQGYPRARSLIQGLEAMGVEVLTLRRDLWPTRGRRLDLVRNPMRWPGLGLKALMTRATLVRELKARIAEQDIDAVVVPYPGHLAVRWARKVFDGPVLLDLFLSLADTVVGDRRMFRAGGRVHRLLRHIDRRACAAADAVMLDTPENATFAAELCRLPEERFFFVPIGDPDAPVHPHPFPMIEPGQPLRAVYIGTGVPLHGIDTVLSAAARTEGMHLTFIGGTPRDRAHARALGPHKTTVIEDWLGADRIHAVLAGHHAVLGVFGTSAKARRVVPYKLVHALAAGRPGVTAETSSIRTLLEPGRDCYTCQPGDAAGLARVFRGILANPALAREVGRLARRSYERRFSPRAIGERLVGGLAAVSGEDWSSPSASPSAAEPPSVEEVPAALREPAGDFETSEPVWSGDAAPDQGAP